MQPGRTIAIRQLNDLLRQTFTGGQILLTRGVHEQGEAAVKELHALLRRYDGFCPDNDPYGEHDFGVIHYEGQKYFWKIDYYDHSYTKLSEDPANPKLTNRVLTLMLAEEY